MPEFKEIIGLMVVFSVIFVPAIGITARLAMRPIVESIIRMREAFNQNPPLQHDEHEIALLRQEIAELTRKVEELREAADFSRALGGTAPKQIESNREL